jgi:hypothetical protein
MEEEYVKEREGMRGEEERERSPNRSILETFTEGDSGDLQALPTTGVSITGAIVTSADGDSCSENGDFPSLNSNLDEGGSNEDEEVSTMLSEVLSDERAASRSGETIEEESFGEGWDSPIDDMDMFLSQRKQYFILSKAGKPIYSMHGTDELISGYMGIIQTIISYFDDENDTNKRLRSFKAGKALFVISIEDPLILIAIDKLGQSESQLRAQLNMLYAQILSTLTKSQIHKVFEGRYNFDLRQLLGGTEKFLNAMTREMDHGSPSILLGALECLRLRKRIRDRINNVLIDCRTSNLLYGMIVADARLVSVIRPRRHSLHPPDLYLVFSMLFNTTVFKDGEEHWVPICLPNFNNTGFLYAYIHFFAPETALVLISPDKNAFFELQEAKVNILDEMKEKQLIDPIQQSIKKGRFKCMDIPAPLIRHFLYKSKQNVQFVMPSFEPHFYEKHSKQRLLYLYHQLHGIAHTRQQYAGGNLKIFHSVRQNLTALAWLTPSFEIYCVTGAPTTKDAISQTVRQVVTWIKQQEERLFVIGGAVF